MRHKNIIIFTIILCMNIFTITDISHAKKNTKTAILRAETHLLFTSMNDFTGGPQVYEDVISDLESILKEAKLKPVIITEEDILTGKVDKYKAIYIIDTLALKQQTQIELKSYVKRGGLLVAIGDFGRNINFSWQYKWYYSELFGLKPIKADQWHASVSSHEKMFSYADLKNKKIKLTKGLKNKIFSGEGAIACWVCISDGATIAASFPEYISTITRKPVKIKKEISAISLNKFGKGYGIYIATWPDKRNSTRFKSGNLKRVILNTKYYIGKKLKKRPAKKPTFYLTASQTGYLPNESKSVILRAVDLKTKKISGKFSIINIKTGKEVFSSVLKKADCYKWNDLYLKGNFTKLIKSGEYKIKAQIKYNNKRRNLKTFSFKIKKDAYTSIIPVQLSFVRRYAAGIDYYLNDPIKGGFIDASGDYSVWMWAMPHAVYSLTELYDNLSKGKSKDETYFLMTHGVKWCLDMQKKNGDINSGITPGFNIFILDKKPWEDTTKRMIKYWKSFNYLATYIASLSRAYQVYIKKDKKMAKRCLKAVKKSYKIFHKFKIESTPDVGNALWAAVELYKCTKDPKLLKDAKKWAIDLIDRQILDEDFSVEGIYGEYSSSKSIPEISSQMQYKMFHNIGIYIGLLELQKMTKDKDLKKKISSSLKTYIIHYLSKMTSLSPYGQLAHGMEKSDYGYEPHYFTPYTSWIGLHALNCDHGAIALFALKYALENNDRQIYNIATHQIQWILGQNPLNYCMISGLGSLNPPLLSEQGTGVIPGGIPNGIGGGLDDRPKWGHATDSKEYWIPQSVYFLAASSLAEKIQNKFKLKK